MKTPHACAEVLVVESAADNGHALGKELHALIDRFTSPEDGKSACGKAVRHFWKSWPGVADRPGKNDGIISNGRFGHAGSPATVDRTSRALDGRPARARARSSRDPDMGLARRGAGPA